MNNNFDFSYEKLLILVFFPTYAWKVKEHGGTKGKAYRPYQQVLDLLCSALHFQMTL